MSHECHVGRNERDSYSYTSSTVLKWGERQTRLELIRVDWIRLEYW